LDMKKFMSMEKNRLMDALMLHGYDRLDVEDVIEAGLPSGSDPIYVLEILSYHASRMNKTNNGINRRNKMKSPFEIYKELSNSGTVYKKIVQEGIELCVICKSNIVDIKFIPCNHTCICKSCYSELGILCPICKTVIDHII
jgi:Zinc finger, C3HC4 type (RING finger)